VIEPNSSLPSDSRKKSKTGFYFSASSKIKPQIFYNIIVLYNRLKKERKNKGPNAEIETSDPKGIICAQREMLFDSQNDLMECQNGRKTTVRTL
jgi:hypothetical protein